MVTLSPKWCSEGLLFRGHKVLPYCPQTGTSYSSHEVSLGYKEVAEPAVYVKFKLVDDESTPTKLQEGMDKYMSAISRQVR